MNNKILSGILLAFVFSSASLLAQDSEKEPDKDSLQYQWDRFSVSLGGFLSTNSSNISMQGQETGLGINISLEDALGLNTTTFVIRGETEYNFGSNRRSHIRLGYFRFLRNANKTLESEITIGDTPYPIGTEVVTKYSLYIIRALYDYSYYKDERISLGVSGGFYVLPMRFSFSTGGVIDESGDIIAPLPVIGARNAFLITPRISLKQNVELLYLKTDSFKGNISDLNIWLEYNTFKHLGLGLGINTFRFNFSTFGEVGNNRKFTGTVGTSFTGLLFYGRYFF